jgi:hypothetical protein
MDRKRILFQRRPRGYKKCWRECVCREFIQVFKVAGAQTLTGLFSMCQKGGLPGTPPVIHHPESLAAQAYNTEALLPGSGLGPNCMHARYWPHVFILVLLDRWPVTPSTRHIANFTSEQKTLFQVPTLPGSLLYSIIEYASSSNAPPPLLRPLLLLLLLSCNGRLCLPRPRRVVALKVHIDHCVCSKAG